MYAAIPYRTSCATRKATKMASKSQESRMYRERFLPIGQSRRLDSRRPLAVLIAAILSLVRGLTSLSSWVAPRRFPQILVHVRSRWISPFLFQQRLYPGKWLIPRRDRNIISSNANLRKAGWGRHSTGPGLVHLRRCFQDFESTAVLRRLRSLRHTSINIPQWSLQNRPMDGVRD